MAVSAGDAHEYPIYNCRFRAVFPILDADGDPVTGATGLDSEASQDSGTFADCTNEATELATNSGFYYLDLISTELDTKQTTVRVQTSSSGAKTTGLDLRPRRLPVLHSGTAQAGAAGTITLASGADSRDNFYVGCFVRASNDTPTGILGECRRITGYVGSTRVATLEANWGTTASSSTTYEVLKSAEALCDLFAPVPVTLPSVNAGHHFLKQSTAVTVPLGPFLDVNGAVLSALTIQKADVRLSKNGGAFAAASADQGASNVGAAHMENGDYGIAFDTTDTGTLGRLRAKIVKTTAGEVWATFEVLTARAWEALESALGSFATMISGTAATGTLTSSAMTTSLTGYNDSRLVGRTVLFTGGALDGEAARISAYSSTGGSITFAATLSAAPVNGQAFLIL